MSHFHVLVIGSGAREHAIAEALARSPLVARVSVAPGNAGIAQSTKCEVVPIDADNILGLLEYARREKPAYTVVGPEAPLVEGIVDAFEHANLPIVGPSQACAQLEGSKSYAKSVMQSCGIPTASYRVCDSQAEAEAYCSHQTDYPLVLKADGLAAGKGVIIAYTRQEALAAIATLWALPAQKNQQPRLVIESFLTGIERSVIALVSGTSYIVLPIAQDYKRRFEGDQGPNTGGMGAICPVPLTDTTEQALRSQVFDPMLHYLQGQGTPFFGFLYAGLMLNPQTGHFSVLEFNTRLGDPETQVILPRLQSDWYKLLYQVAHKQALPASHTLEWDPRVAVGIVLAGAQYPEYPLPPTPISGPLRTRLEQGLHILHAGTTCDPATGQWTATGGRLITVTALADTADQAQDSARQQLETIHCANTSFRRDIGT